MANDFTEKLFQSIDTIVSSRLKDLEYDQTIICEIKDVSNSESGIYQVESQGAIMTVYSERKDFAVGDFVYVLIPLGDYTGKKTILEKVIGMNDVVMDARPFETFAPAINNINKYYGTTLDEHTFIVNRDYEKVLYQEFFDNPKQFLGYNRFGFKISIYSNLKTMTQEVVSGKYRILITLNGVDLSKENSLDYTNKDEREFFLDMKDMVFINPYFTSGYCNQEKVFDIQDFSVTSIKISVKQIEDFLDQNEEKVSSESFFINFKNLYCAFGFECKNTDIDKEKLYIHSADGLCYNSGITEKKVDAKLVQFYRDANTLMPQARVADPINLKAWGRYSPESSIIDDNFKIPGYSSLESASLERGDDGFFTLSLNTNKGLQQNRFILSMDKVLEDKKILLVLSNEITFKNNDFIKNADLLDNIMGFTGKLSDGRESFNIYGLDNKLLNDFEENHIFYLIVSYNSVNGRQIEPKDEITWTFPSENTMLIPYPDNGKHTFTVRIPEVFDDNYPEEKVYRIPFKIKNVYNQNYINNTINCSLSFVDSNGYTQNLSFSKTILFGFSGSEGSKYIYNLELYKRDDRTGENVKIQCISNKQTDFDDYTLKLNIFDYNMKPIDINSNAYTIMYKWIIDDDYKSLNEFKLSRFNEILNKKDRIIVAKCSYGSGDIEESSLSYLPIGTIYEDQLSNDTYLLEGCKTIVYNMLGTKPYYYKGSYHLYRNKALVTAGINFEVNASNLTNEILKPIITKGSNKIKPYGTYIDGFTNFSILVLENKKLILEFPVVIMRGQYSAMTEYLEESFSVLNSEKVKEVLLGQLSFNQDGKTEGIVIGKNDTNNSSIGLYSYIDNKNFFTLDNITGLLVGDPEESIGAEKINLWNGNLHNFNLYNCSGSIGNATIANSAKKIIDSNSNALSLGSAVKPVYFENGVPVICAEMATTTQLQQLSQQISSMQSTIERLQRQIESLS